MSQPENRAEAFETRRGRLFGLAYRMLGSRAEAEDVVQEAYVRWHQAAQDEIRNAEAWLVATTTRLAIDRLRRLKTEREAYTGMWLPEPLVGGSPPPAPDAHVELSSDLSMAFLVLLERLAPEERAAFLLHDVFDCGYDDIARILGKSEAAVRQTTSRARDRVRRDRKRFETSEEAKLRLAQAFAAAVAAQDEQALFALFTPDVTWTADGGGRTPASPHPIVGAEKVAKVLIGLTRTVSSFTFEVANVNGEPGLLVRIDGRLAGTVSFAVEGGRIAAGYTVVNPDKLGALAQ